MVTEIMESYFNVLVICLKTQSRNDLTIFPLEKLKNTLVLYFTFDMKQLKMDYETCVVFHNLFPYAIFAKRVPMVFQLLRQNLYDTFVSPPPPPH